MQAVRLLLPILHKLKGLVFLFSLLFVLFLCCFTAAALARFAVGTLAVFLALFVAVIVAVAAVAAAAATRHVVVLVASAAASTNPALDHLVAGKLERLVGGVLGASQPAPIDQLSLEFVQQLLQLGCGSQDQWGCWVSLEKQNLVGV